MQTATHSELQFLVASCVILTEICDVVARGVERARVELQSDDGEDDDGKEQQQRNVDQGTDGLADGRHHDLETWMKNGYITHFSFFLQSNCRGILHLVHVESNKICFLFSPVKNE